MRRKRRSLNQIYEEKSFECFKSIIPEQWVVHEYGPDYGIDFVLELFDFVDESDPPVAETLGEVIFVQLKSSKGFVYDKINVFPRGNVAKGPLSEDKSEFYEIEVIKFQIETSELLTVQAMGPAIPVILVLVDLNTEKIYYVCLNDYIDKIIIPSDSDFHSKDSKVIYVPIRNELLNQEINLTAFRFYGKRAKMYGAFNIFSYQMKEVERSLGLTFFEENISGEYLLKMLETFTRICLNQDIWHGSDFWKPINRSYQELIKFKALLTDPNCISKPEFKNEYFTIWHGLDNLSNMYEELCREWFLPSFLSVLLSYPGYEAAQSSEKKSVSDKIIEAAGKRQIILNTNGKPEFSVIEETTKVCFYKDNEGIWRSSKGDLLERIHDKCTEISLAIISSLFDSPYAFEESALSFPKSVSFCGLNAESSISISDFKDLVEKHKDNEAFNRYLYYCDFQNLVSGIQECLNAIIILQGEFYERFNYDRIFNVKLREPDGLKTSSSPTVTKIHAILYELFNRMFNMLNLVSKLAYEAQKPQASFHTCLKLNSQNIFIL